MHWQRATCHGAHHLSLSRSVWRQIMPRSSRGLPRGLVMTVQRSTICEAQVLRHALNYPERLQPAMEAVCRNVEEHGLDPEKVAAVTSMGLGYTKASRIACLAYQGHACSAVHAISQALCG
jgi:hypothetical protein